MGTGTLFIAATYCNSLDIFRGRKRCSGGLERVKGVGRGRYGESRAGKCLYRVNKARAMSL